MTRSRSTRRGFLARAAAVSAAVLVPGAAVELVVRVLDVRERGTNGRAKHFYLFEDETGLLEGIGERRCVVVGTPPVCFLRGEIRRGVEGIPKVFNCEFLRGF